MTPADSSPVHDVVPQVNGQPTRGRLMAELAVQHPGYGWEKNAGYGTAQHMEALRRQGPTPHHRTSFAPIAQLSLL
jgi:ribonuclease HII